MESKSQSLHEVVITAIVSKDGKYLVTQRSMKEKRFPGFWTVPGGKLELVISCIADYASGEVKLQEDEADNFVWVTLKEAKNYNLIDGIFDELVLADKKRRGIKEEWSRNV